MLAVGVQTGEALERARLLMASLSQSNAFSAFGSLPGEMAPLDELLPPWFKLGCCTV
jgi:hypothetical protein